MTVERYPFHGSDRSIRGMLSWFDFPIAISQTAIAFNVMLGAVKVNEKALLW